MSRDTLFDSAFLRKLDRLTLMTRRAIAGNIQGERRSPKRGSSVEFSDFRPYTTGDDIRQIDWNLYARMERFFLKLFVAEEELTVHLLIDNSASMRWGEPDKFDYARRLAGAFGYIALNGLDRVTVSGFGGAPLIRGVRGRQGAFPLFKSLQGMQPSGGPKLREVCRRYAQMSQSPGPLLICSDLLDPEWREALQALMSRRFDITVAHILSPQELEPELEGDLRLLDPEGGPPVEISVDDALLERYRSELQEWRTSVEHFCRGRDITYMFVDTSVPIETFIIQEVRTRGVLR